MIKKLTPGQIIALGFVLVILLGSGLLMLPCSVQPGWEITYIDALYMSASAVCVTGLAVVDTGTAFTPIGRFFMAMLIQVGGLGVATVGTGVMLAMGKKINLKGRNLIREAGNLENGRGAIRFLKSVLLTTLTIELLGAVLSFPVFLQDYTCPEALGYSLFHSISAFNNSGFDILGNSGDLHSSVSLLAYHENGWMNLVTSGLIIFGGIGFLVIQEMRRNKLHWKNYSMHAKVVMTTTLALILSGTVLIKLTEGSETWMGAYFQSVSTRTAGFATTDLSTYSSAGLLLMIVLMFIGASPGSTGGGIKTTTFFVMLKGIQSAATNKTEKAFHYAIPRELFRKAAVIIMLALCVVLTGTYLMLLMEPGVPFLDVLFEVTSAFATVGLSTGITSSLSVGSKLLSIVIMYIGRLGPLTVACLWHFTKGDRVGYPDGNIAIG
ncbi:MAG: TrkH family potassium uptake protein [Faecousia sp.]